MTLMGVALLNGIVGMLSPEGALKKYVRLLGALCLICAIAHPIFSLLSEGNWKIEALWEGSAAENSEAYEELYEDILLSGSERYAAEKLRGELMGRFELSEASFDVAVREGSRPRPLFCAVRKKEGMPVPSMPFQRKVSYGI